MILIRCSFGRKILRTILKINDLFMISLVYKILFCLFVTCVYQSTSVGSERKKLTSNSLTVFSWWDYITPEVQQSIKKKGINFNIVEYRSNEVALSKLLSSDSDFDVVIISNWVLNVLSKANYLDPIFNKSILRNREYIPFLEKLSGGCIPYMWSTTTFAIQANDKGIAPNSMQSFISLKEKGIKISFVDDPIEFAARTFLDNKNLCKNISKSDNPLEINQSCITELKKMKNQVDPRDFRTTIENFLGPNTAVYTWNGEVGMHLASHPEINFHLPQSEIILGADLVCIPKKKHYKKNLNLFVEILTNKESTQQQIGVMQYFSPYQNHIVNQHPKMTKLKNEILERLKYNKPIFLIPPSVESHDIINKWWQDIRYGNK